MSAQPIESRIAHIEGVNVQIADRLNGIDGRLDALGGRIDSLDRGLRSELGGRIDSLDKGLRSEMGDLRSDMNARFAQVDQKFMWVIGINVTSWTTIMLALIFRH